jgi:glycosyltransferase involved in cell wall biosynthesis
MQASRFYRIPVGYAAGTIEGPLPETDIDLFFYGSYIPLQGVPVIVDALAELTARGVVANATFVGDGQTRGETAAKLEALGLNVTMVHTLQPGELYNVMARAKVCLGIFGTSKKAQCVVPNKVFDALALGKAVVTADSPGIREFFEPGRHLVTVPPNNPTALADALADLLKDPEARAIIGRAGREHVQRVAGPVAVREALAGALTAV